ncbi:unnamed protein product [[Candida] boidinii]|uniref:Unnamed protein product n=1 Tax=Candida boidinii TaxID=5477 RepID=A0A9W6SU56_CANBO|nr:unnamed protein product [[Candida] boidinii]
METSKENLFFLEPVQLQFQIQSDIVKLLVSDNVLCLVLHNGLIYRIDLNNPEKVDRLSVFDSQNGLMNGDSGASYQSDTYVTNAFLDPKGYHLFVITSKNQVYYSNSQSKQIKNLSKFKGLSINKICFINEYVTMNNTGSILMSTDNGLIYETIVSFNKEYFQKQEKFLKQVYKTRENILDISYCSRTTDSKVDGLQIMVVLGNGRMTNFTTTISNYSNSKSNLSQAFKNESKTYNLTKIKLFSSNFNNFVFCDDNNDLILGNKSFSNKNDLQKITTSQDLKGTGSIKSLLLTKYHIIILTDTQIVFYNQLNGKLCYKIDIDTSLLSSTEKLLHLTADYLADTFWMFSNEKIYEIVANDESSGMWKIMLDMKLFDEALKVLRHDDKVNRDIVLTCQGRHYLKIGKYKEAAEILANTSESFEKVAIKLMENKQTDALISYCINKLNILPKQQAMQRTMVSSWCVELFIEKLNDLENQISIRKSNDKNNMLNGSKNIESTEIEETTNNKSRNGSNSPLSPLANPTPTASSASTDSSPTEEESVVYYMNEKRKLVISFHEFLVNFKDVLDKETVYQIILSHNFKDELIFYSNLINDYDFVLSYYVSLKKWSEALKILTLQKNPIFIYKYSTVMLISYPVKTAEVWMRFVDNLDVKKLLPAILTYNKSLSNRVSPENHQGLRILNYFIKEKNIKSSVVHNTLLSLLLSYPNSGDDESIIFKYFEVYCGNGHSNKKSFMANILNSSSSTSSTTNSLFTRNDFSKNEILFDTDFILRLCFRYNKIQSAIYIYSLLENYSEAVHLALDNDLIEVAAFVADKPDDLSIERKKLWLKVAKKLIDKVVTNDKYLNEHKEALSKIDLNFNDSKDNDGQHQQQQEKELSESESDDKNTKIQDLINFLLSKCSLLTIKDLLPLFPDFVVINNFKQDIVSSLEHLSRSMNKLTNEMNNSLNTSVKVKEKIKNFKNNSFQIIEPTENCQICNKILVSRKFFVFPCNHSFHQDCLAGEILNSNDYKLKNNIYILQKKLAASRNNPDEISLLKKEIDETLSTTCCLCSDIMINSIDEPFIKGDDRAANEWDLSK